MNSIPLEKDIIIKRVDGIEKEIIELKQIAKQNYEDFEKGDGWKLAQFHLHRALEGVFNIGSHILSRLPGATATQYKEIALKLGEFKIIPNDFAEKKLVEMAKYRNRLIHFYAQIKPKELYQIINNDLDDFDIFLKSVKNLLNNPQDFGLQAE